MPIEVTCPTCSRKVRAPDKAVHAKCPKCTTRFDVKDNQDRGVGKAGYLLGGALLAIVLFCVLMAWLT